MASTQKNVMFAVREEIIEDHASGLTLQFEQDEAGTTRMRIHGDQASGDREIHIGAADDVVEAGAVLTSTCCPSWLRETAFGA